jgi:hypothetical protein
VPGATSISPPRTQGLFKPFLVISRVPRLAANTAPRIHHPRPRDMRRHLIGMAQQVAQEATCPNDIRQSLSILTNTASWDPFGSGGGGGQIGGGGGSDHGARHGGEQSGRQSTWGPGWVFLEREKVFLERESGVLVSVLIVSREFGDHKTFDSSCLKRLSSCLGRRLLHTTFANSSPSSQTRPRRS